MQRSGKEDSTRHRWRQTEGERERERQREEEGEERESVVNGEQRVFQSGFRPVSDPFWGRSRGFALFLEKRLNLMLRQ